jgi:ABC-type nitrate/sulfonate/bicarbonate transport system substrate-binding protein
MYRQYRPRPASADHLRYAIRTSEAFIARMEAERNDAAADWERTRLEALQADLARLIADTFSPGTTTHPRPILGT